MIRRALYVYKTQKASALALALGLKGKQRKGHFCRL